MIGIDTTFLVHLEIAEAPEHSKALQLLQSESLAPGVPLALTPQVLLEFVHVVTDPKRFSKPLSMDEALDRSNVWWSATEVRHVFPTPASTSLFLDWMRKHRLGRKRLLDTHLAAVLRTAGVNDVFTSNVRDFAVFGGFRLISP